MHAAGGLITATATAEARAVAAVGRAIRSGTVQSSAALTCVGVVDAGLIGSAHGGAKTGVRGDLASVSRET